MAQKKRKRRKSRQGPSAMVILLVLLALTMVLLVLIHLVRTRTGAQRAAETEPGVTVSALPTLPPSYLDAACFGEVNGYKTYESDDLTAALGVDVSAYQGSIDWEAVADSDVEFAILRAGYRGYGDGLTGPDEYFEYNLEQTAAWGIDVGIYFFSQALTEEEAVAEAREVLAAVEGYEIRYPIYFDWEPISDSTARTASISSSEVTRCAKAFCHTIEDAGYRAGVYFNLDLARHYYHLYDLTDYTFWLAEYDDVPTFPYAYDMWQYTSSGSVPGIPTRVDLDLSFLPAQ